MATSIYSGNVTAWNHASNSSAAWASREKRVATRQANRMLSVAVLTLLSLGEGVTIIMGLWETKPLLEVLCAVCIMCNIPLIVRLVYLWCIEERREEQIRNQYNKK